MDTVELPDDLLEKDEIKALPREERNQYLEDTIERVLELNSEKGVTAKELQEALNYDSRTISKKLEVLVAKRIAYKVVQGRSIRYFKNGRLVHPIFEDDLTLGDKVYSFKALFDGDDILVFIQENEKNSLGVTTEGGGIVVPLENIEEFADRASEIESKVPAIKEKLKEEWADQFVEMVE